MPLFTNTEFNSFQDLFEEQIKDLYDAEQRLTEALPKMAEACEFYPAQTSLPGPSDGNTRARLASGADLPRD